MEPVSSIINTAIIAHVDHGKTTLVDKLLISSDTLDAKEQGDRVMDSNDLERERGITILSKNTALLYKGHKINIIDTPGHADFGGEVERVLKMVDSCVLLVDAQEGPMPQTRFVLKKSLELGHKVIVVINKIDRPNCNPDEAVDKVFDLFVELGANDDQLDFPIAYASAKEGYAKLALEDENKDMFPILDLILDKAPHAESNLEAPFQFQVTTLGYDNYLGRLCIGRIWNGKIHVGDTVTLSGKSENGEEVESKHKVSQLFGFLGLKRVATENAQAGDIVAIAGIDELTIGDTLSDPENVNVLQRIDIEPPTVSMQFWVNDSPLAGNDGEYVTSRNIRERLARELQSNISLQVEDNGDSFTVMGRGELQLAILIENMRREGFELGVAKPEVIIKEIDGQKCEPFESVVFDLPEACSGAVIQELNRRKGTMVEMENLSETTTRVRYEVPTRGIIGFRSFFLTETKGEGTMAGNFLEYRPYTGKISGRTRGAIVSLEAGQTNTYALFNIQDRGELFVGVGVDVYRGMIIGKSAKEGDLDVNPLKEKKLTNVRASGSDDALRLTPHKDLTLEQCLDFLEADELLEVTPKHLRLRKKITDPTQRKRAARTA